LEIDNQDQDLNLKINLETQVIAEIEQKDQDLEDLVVIEENIIELLNKIEILYFYYIFFKRNDNILFFIKLFKKIIKSNVNIKNIYVLFFIKYIFKYIYI
jgi:hypothetical protein